MAYLIILTRLWPFGQLVRVWRILLRMRARHVLEVVGQNRFVVGYGIFAFSSVVILLGGSLYFGIQEWNILNIIDRLDNVAVVVLAMSVFLLTTISTNATGNIIPAGYQLAALFPKNDV